MDEHWRANDVNVEVAVADTSLMLESLTIKAFPTSLNPATLRNRKLRECLLSVNMVD